MQKIKSQKDIDRILYGKGINHLNRFDIFLDRIALNDTVPDELYWSGLRLAYCGTDNLYSHKRMIKRCFSSKRTNRESLMTKSERTFLNKLPSKVKIYRAMTVVESKSKDYGISWTLDKKTAEFFKEKYQRNFDTYGLEKTILRLDVNRADIVAYINEREEKEIIYISK